MEELQQYIVTNVFEIHYIRPIKNCKVFLHNVLKDNEVIKVLDDQLTNVWLW